MAEEGETLSSSFRQLTFSQYFFTHNNHKKGGPGASTDVVKSGECEDRSSLLSLENIRRDEVVSSSRRIKCRSLKSLCIGVLGQHLEDITDDLSEIAKNLPPDIKMALVAIAKRRKLLNDNILVPLADSSWEVLDISGSDVSNFGLSKVAKMCKSLRVVDISCCWEITPRGVEELLRHCLSLETLRCGGSPRSDLTARKSLGLFMPKLNDLGSDSWEEVDVMNISIGPDSLRWLVWPNIDSDSRQSLAEECPRIVVNPKRFSGLNIPIEAFPDVKLDDHFVKDIDPKTWASEGLQRRVVVPTVAIPKKSLPMVTESLPMATESLPIAEKFRLAYVERDAERAPKRAKNARQRNRRAEREWVMKNTDAKSIALATQLGKSLQM